jgi:hypothetical protein
MSRDFNGTSALLSLSAGVITGFPFAISVHYRPTELSGSDKDLFSTHDDPSVPIAVRLSLRSAASWKPTLYMYDGTYKEVNAGGAGSTTNTWQHAMAVANSTASYSVFYNGVNKATGTTAVTMTPANLDRIALGRTSWAASDYFTGQLAHCAVWSGTGADIPDDLVAVLAAGLLPTRVRPTALRAYWSLSGKDSPEIDIVGRNDLTITNATVSNEEPRIVRPWLTRIFA